MVYWLKNIKNIWYTLNDYCVLLCVCFGKHDSHSNIQSILFLGHLFVMCLEYSRGSKTSYEFKKTRVDKWRTDITVEL